jgi:hypothetical protein
LLNSNKSEDFVMEVEYVCCILRTEFLNIVEMNFMVKELR